MLDKSKLLPVPKAIWCIIQIGPILTKEKKSKAYRTQYMQKHFPGRKIHVEICTCQKAIEPKKKAMESEKKHELNVGDGGSFSQRQGSPDASLGTNASPSWRYTDDLEKISDWLKIVSEVLAPIRDRKGERTHGGDFILQNPAHHRMSTNTNIL